MNDLESRDQIIGDLSEKLISVEAEVARLQTAIDLTHACPVCPERADNVELRAEVVRLRGKLNRIIDVIKFAANSNGGLVAEIKHALAVKKPT